MSWKNYDASMKRRFQQKLKRAGFKVARYNGSHAIWKNENGKIISVPLRLNALIAKSIIRENKLI